jgi:peptide/nickel transport system permease protein
MAVQARPIGAGANRSGSNLLLGFIFKLAQLVIVLWVISSLLFFLVRLTGDPAELLAGENARPETIEQIRKAYGLNDPLHIQYLNFIGGVLRLDFGKSIQVSNATAMGLILERFPATFTLAILAMMVAILIAVPLGTIAAINRGKFVDRFISMTVALGQSIPSFVFGLLLILLFAINLKWLPTSGQEGAQYLILPVLTLSFGLVALLTRLVRSNLLDVLSQDYIRTARSKGLAGVVVLWRHALRNTMLTVMTVIGLNLSGLLGGAVIVEQLFAYPGVGTRLVAAINARDFPTIQAGVFIIALIVFTVNAMVDFLYTVADPRIRKK